MNYGIVAAARTSVTEAIPDIDYETGAVHFDGSAYLSRGAGLTGWGTPSKFTSVVWTKLSSCEDGIFSDANYFTQGTTADGANRYINANVANAYCESLAQITSASWQCFMLSMDLTDAPTEVDFSLYLGDTDTLGISSHGSASSTITAGSDFFFGQDGFGVKIVGDVADFRLWLGHAVDLSIVSNRRLFIRSNGKPADPTLAVAALGNPIISFIGSKADPTSTFVVNGGTGGTFTLSGSVTPTLSPTDTALDARSSFAGAGNLIANATVSTHTQEASANFAGAGQAIINSQMILTASQTFTGAGAMAVDLNVPFSVAFTQSLTGNDSGGQSYSERIICGTLSAGGTKIRVTFKASSVAGWNVDNASVGKQSATYVTTATPVELLFGGSSGFSIAAGATATSDWATLTTNVGDTLVVVFDNGASNGNPAKSDTGGSRYWIFGDTYNLADPAGSFSSDSNRVGVLEIDVRD